MKLRDIIHVEPHPSQQRQRQMFFQSLEYNVIQKVRGGLLAFDYRKDRSDLDCEEKEDGTWWEFRVKRWHFGGKRIFMCCIMMSQSMTGSIRIVPYSLDV